MSHFTVIVVGSLTGFYLLYEKKTIHVIKYELK